MKYYNKIWKGTKNLRLTSRKNKNHIKSEGICKTETKLEKEPDLKIYNEIDKEIKMK